MVNFESTATEAELGKLNKFKELYMSMNGCFDTNSCLGEAEHKLAILERKVCTFVDKYNILSESEKEIFRADMDSFISWIEALLELHEKYGD